MNRLNRKYQYSIRKTTFGVGSVVVGVMLAGMLHAPSVLANTISDQTTTNLANQNPSIVPVEENTGELATDNASTENLTREREPEFSLTSGESSERAATEPVANSASDTVAGNTEIRTVTVPVPIDSTWAQATSTNTSEGSALSAVDNKSTTYWASNESQPNSPESRQTLTVRLTEQATVNKVLYTPRQAANGSAVGTIKKGRIWYSTDGESWQQAQPLTVKQYIDNSSQGSVESDNVFQLQTNMYPKYIEITPVVAQYFKLEGIETHHWDQSKLNKVVSVAEFKPFGTKPIAENTLVTINPELLEAVSSQNPHTKDKVIDGNPGTFWQSSESTDNRSTKQYLTIGLNEKATVSFLQITPRQDGSNHRDYATGDIKRAYIEYKTDDNTWERVTYPNSNNNYFEFGGTKETKFIQFNPVDTQYLRVAVEQAHHWNNPDLNKLVAIAEVYTHGNKIIPPVEEQGNQVPETPTQPETPPTTPEVTPTPAPDTTTP
ncbi:TPA: discoidin domain-containing protein, partial [Streptococcus suis]